MCAANDALTLCVPPAGNNARERLQWRHPGARRRRPIVAEVLCYVQETELLTGADLAARLKCSPSFVYRHTKNKPLSQFP